MIKINSIELPDPSTYSVGIQDISKADRNANGTMIIERIATKRKIDLAWQYISGDDLSNVLNLVSAVLFTVEYMDPQTGGLNTGTFYCGDRNTGGLYIKDEKMNWKDIKFSLVER